MATQGNNLSQYDLSAVPDGRDFRIGIITSEWNAEITSKLTGGAVDALLQHGVKTENILRESVPGSFELPLGAQWLLENNNLDAVICIGSVIRGETAHFEYVSNAVSQGIKDVALKTGKPVIFCVLTDDHIEQSRARSGGKHGNKGVEAAITALKMIALRKRL